MKFILELLAITSIALYIMKCMGTIAISWWLVWLPRIIAASPLIFLLLAGILWLIAAIGCSIYGMFAAHSMKKGK